MHSASDGQNDFYEQLYLCAPIGIAKLSTDGHFLQVNPALCRMLGFEAGELLGRHVQNRADTNAFMPVSLMDLNESAPHNLLEFDFLHRKGHSVRLSAELTLISGQQEGTDSYYIAYIRETGGIETVQSHENNHLYELIANYAHEMIYISSRDGICLFCSPSTAKILGYRPEELIGRNNYELFHPDDLKIIQDKTKDSESLLQYRFRHKNGQYMWLETSFQFVTSNQGEKNYVLAIGREITERKHQEDILAEAMRVAAVGSWEWRVQENLVTVSDQVYRIYNRSRRARDGRPFELADFVEENDREPLKAKVQKALEGNDLNYEYQYVRKDGSVQYLHLRGVVSFDESSKPIRMNGTVQDVTDRKHAEFKLQETIERYTSLKKYNHDAIFSLDLSGHIMNGNVMAENLTGYKISELSGTIFSEFIGENQLKLVLGDCLQDNSSHNQIEWIKHKSGHVAEILSNIVPIIINNIKVGFYVIAKDITEQKKLLIAKEAAESTNKAKSEFLAMMSHEIRTPMNGVIGMTDLLMETTVLDNQQLEYLDIIRKSGDALLKIIDDILDFAKVESGKTILQAEAFDLRNCVRETVSLLSAKAEEKRLKISWQVSSDVPAQLIGDSDRLKQVLINLIGNSIKFTYTGGIAVSVVKLDQDSESVKLKFVVKDTGIGIPLDQADQLFEPFYQLGNFMTRKFQGTGLGLAISRKLVELLGGEIWLEESNESGAAFAFTVRLTAVHTEPLDSTGDLQSGMEEHQTRKLNILVAEDNETNQFVLRKMLEKHGHRIQVANNGKEVLHAVAYDSFDLIFMDVQMPVMNGLEAAQMIKETIHEDKRPVIVAVTANALKGDRELYLQAGMDDYLSKPIKSQMIADIIQKYFST
ncbi:PAS domain S-box protein [Paenibacillus lutrae]|nr:PAS domain S-box protein [Paenibacillus lutrae]